MNRAQEGIDDCKIWASAIDDKTVREIFNMDKKTICVDLDGTLAEYNGWKGINNIGKPFPAAKEFMTKLSNKYKIIIFTVRTNVSMNVKDIPGYVKFEDYNMYLRKLVEEWLVNNEIPYDEVWTGQGKPAAHYYIDDRAIHVENGIYPEI